MTKAARKLNILYGEGDAEVLAAQADAIAKAGHEVQQAVGRKAVLAALGNGKFDLIVLGATLTRNDRHHLPYMVKKANFATQVLVLHADGSRHPYVDGWADTGATVEAVVAKIGAVTPGAVGAAAGR